MTPEPAEHGDGPVARQWPPGPALPAAELLAARCATCGDDWRVDRRMAGFRLRCHCGAWLDVPAQPATPLPATPALAAEPAVRPPRALERRPDDRGLVHLRGEDGAVHDGQIPTSLPMAPGTLMRSSAAARARWTDRSLLEIGALLAAILGPQIAAHLLATGNETALLLPFAGLVSCGAVLAVGLATSPYAALGLRAAAPVRYAEAILLAGVAFCAAVAYVHLLGDAMAEAPLDDLRGRLGTGWALWVMAGAPAIAEELAFRGVLQGRLMALLGARLGIVTTATLFTLCHLQPAVMPIHLAIGLALGLLRERSGSLLPGMLMHLLYNGALVIAAA